MARYNRGRANTDPSHGGSSSGSSSSGRSGGGSSGSSLAANSAARGQARALAIQSVGGSLSTAGKAALAAAQKQAASLTPAAAMNLYTMTADSLSPEDRAKYNAAVQQYVDMPDNQQQAFIQQLQAANKAKDDAALAKIKTDETNTLSEVTSNQDQLTGDELRKQWLSQFSDKGGGGEFGEGSGVFRGFANEAQGERNRIVGQAKVKTDASITAAQADYDANRQIADVTQQKDLAALEQDRTKGRQFILSDFLGLGAAQNNQSQSQYIYQPQIPSASSGQTSSYYGPVGSGYRQFTTVPPPPSGI